MAIYTHETVQTAAGLLAQTGIVWGSHALQSVSIGRHTPREAQLAIANRGVVDYTSGMITSDVTLDVILTEGGTAASTDASVFDFAQIDITVGTESYVMTSAAINFAAAQPATASSTARTGGAACRGR